MYLLCRDKDLNALSHYVLAGRSSAEKLYEARIKCRQWNYTVNDVLSAEHLLHGEHNAVRNAEYGSTVERREKCANRKRDRC